MVLHDFGKGKPTYISGFLRDNLDLYKLMVKKKWDFFAIFAGKEGDGKSVLANTVMKYLDPTFNLDRVFFKGKDFLEAIINCEDKKKAFLLDEGQEFTSRAAMSAFNKVFVKVLSKIRAKQLYLGICIPDFWELDSYAAVHRANCLMRVYTVELQRGYFEFYNWERKKKLYYEGKKKGRDYGLVKFNFNNDFTLNSFPHDMEKYEERKMEDIREITLDELEQVNKNKLQRDALIHYLNKVIGVSHVKISEILNSYGHPLSKTSVGNISLMLRSKSLGDLENNHHTEINTINKMVKEDIFLSSQEDGEQEQDENSPPL